MLVPLFVVNIHKCELFSSFIMSHKQIALQYDDGQFFQSQQTLCVPFICLYLLQYAAHRQIHCHHFV